MDHTVFQPTCRTDAENLLVFWKTVPNRRGNIRSYDVVEKLTLRDHEQRTTSNTQELRRVQRIHRLYPKEGFTNLTATDKS